MDRPVNPFDRPPGKDEPFDVDDASSWSDEPADDLTDEPADDLSEGSAAGSPTAASLEASYGHLFGDRSTPQAPPTPTPTAPSPTVTPFSTDPAPSVGAPDAPSAPAAATAAPPATTTAPAAVATTPAAARTATALLEHDDDEPVGLFARTPFVPGTGPRVHLLPPEVVTVRRVHHAQVRGALVLLGVVALVVAAYALASGERAMAREDLASAQQRTAELTAEQARYARAPQVYAQVEDTRGALASVMAADVRWYQYLADLAVTSPAGLWLTSWSATAADPTLAPAAAPAAAGAPAPVATLTVSGTAADEPEVADWLDVLSGTPGLAGSTASSLTRTAVGEQPVITFDSSASMTGAALSDRYAAKDPR